MLPWADLLRFAAWRLSWTPADFWSATPRELEAVLGLHRPGGALTRCDFDRLRHAYPDRATELADWSPDRGEAR